MIDTLETQKAQADVDQNPALAESEELPSQALVYRNKKRRQSRDSSPESFTSDLCAENKHKKCIPIREKKQTLPRTTCDNYNETERNDTEDSLSKERIFTIDISNGKNAKTSGEPSK